MPVYSSLVSFIVAMRWLPPAEAIGGQRGRARRAASPANFSFAPPCSRAPIFKPLPASRGRRWLQHQQVVTCGGCLPQNSHLPHHTWACSVVYSYQAVTKARPGGAATAACCLASPCPSQLFRGCPSSCKPLSGGASASCALSISMMPLRKALPSPHQAPRSCLRNALRFSGMRLLRPSARRRQPKRDFLGIDHDLQDCLSHGQVPSWIRPRLIDKIVDLMDTADSYNTLPPGLASKLVGCLPSGGLHPPHG